MIDLTQLVVSIDMRHEQNMLVISPHIEHPTPLTLQYRMTVSQHASGNNSSIAQQGDIQSGAPAGSVRINVPEGGTCLVHLEVLQYDRLVSTLERSCRLE